MRGSELQGRHLAMFTDRVLNEHEMVLEIREQMQQAQLDTLELLKRLAGEDGEVKQIELEEVKTEKRLKIKRGRKKRKPKSLLLAENEEGNGNGKGRKKLKETLNQADEPLDTTDPTDKYQLNPAKPISNPHWKKLR